MGFKSFEEIPVWKEAHRVVLNVYEITASFPNEEKFGLVSQIRRSSASVATNIVEGFYKDTTKELIRHLYHARGSCGETLYHLLLSKDLNYISNKEYNRLAAQLDSIAKQLNGWIRSLRANRK